MYNLFSLQFVGYFLVFLIAIFVSFYLPGKYALDKLITKKLSFSHRILLSFVIGLALWGVQGYAFGYLHVRFLTYLYLLFFVYHFVRYVKVQPRKFVSSVQEVVETHKLATAIIIFGSLLQVLQVFGSGLMYQEGVRFFGNNSYDGVMHLAYIQALMQHFPPIEPGLAGTPLVNYHYWSDLIIADIARIWGIPVNLLFFQFFPLIISVLTGVAAYAVVRVWGWSKTAGLWSLFFLYFAGDATYLVLAAAHRPISFITPAIDNGVAVFLNMPNTMAKMVFLTSLISFEKWLRTKERPWNIITILLFAVLVGLKIYYGIFVALGYFLVVVVMICKNFVSKISKKGLWQNFLASIRKGQQFIISGIALMILSAVIYLPANSGAGGLVISPLEWPKIFLGTGVLNWGDWTLRQQVYEAANNYRNIFFLDAIAIIITLVSIHGTRLIGFLPSRKIYHQLGWEKLIFFIPGVLIFHILGLFTLQQSGGLNVFNFFVVATVVMSLFTAGILAADLPAKRFLKILLIVLVIGLTIPRVVFETYDVVHKYLNVQIDSRLVSHDELQGLTFIREHTSPQDIIQTSPANFFDRKTPYVAYFTNRPTFTSGEILLDTHNQPVSWRKDEVDQMFQETSSQGFVNWARKNHINIVYLLKTKDQQLKFNPDSNLLKKIYENNSVLIYRVQ